MKIAFIPIDNRPVCYTLPKLIAGIDKSIELKVGNEKSIETLYATSFGKVGTIKYAEGE